MSSSDCYHLARSQRDRTCELTEESQATDLICSTASIASTNQDKSSVRLNNLMPLYHYVARPEQVGWKHHKNRIKVPSSLASLLVYLLLLLPRECTAGMKGNKGGRPGHIIVQNEVKGNPVPVYMPIPIPIPMPMGPSAGKHFQHGPTDHFPQHQQQQIDADVEVKKIYLLQPMPKVQPPPHLKGGGFVGPVQNHIHLGGVVHKQHGRTHSHRQQFGADEPQQQQQPVDEQGNPRQLHSSKSGAEVKILPIVMIPPIAPLPPIQLADGLGPSSARMTMTPQFNNYLVAGPPERRSRMPMSHYGARQELFSDYGGSLGASVFRDNYARSRSTPRARAARLAAENHANSNRARLARNFDILDYGDYDYDTSASRARSNRLGAASRRSTGRKAHVNSIRDVLEAHGSQQFDDEVDFEHEPATGEQLAAPESSLLTNAALQRRLKAQPTDLSLDELALQAEREQSRLNMANGGQSKYANKGQDLSSLYYDQDSQESHQRPVSKWQQNQQRQLEDYRDSRNLLDDDEWRFESIKSVAHISPAANGTRQEFEPKSNSTSTKTDHGLKLCPWSSSCTNSTAPAVLTK